MKSAISANGLIAGSSIVSPFNSNFSKFFEFGEAKKRPAALESNIRPSILFIFLSEEFSAAIYSRTVLIYCPLSIDKCSILAKFGFLENISITLWEKYFELLISILFNDLTFVNASKQAEVAFVPLKLSTSMFETALLENNGTKPSSPT